MAESEGKKPDGEPDRKWQQFALREAPRGVPVSEAWYWSDLADAQGELLDALNDAGVGPSECRRLASFIRKFCLDGSFFHPEIFALFGGSAVELTTSESRALVVVLRTGKDVHFNVSGVTSLPKREGEPDQT